MLFIMLIPYNIISKKKNQKKPHKKATLRVRFTNTMHQCKSSFGDTNYFQEDT